MKHVVNGLLCGLFLIVCATPAFGQAAPKRGAAPHVVAPPPVPPVPPAPVVPAISVDLVSSTKLKVTATLPPGAKCATNEDLAASCAAGVAGACPVTETRTLTAPFATTPIDLQSNSVPAWLTQGLSGQEIYCAVPPVAAAAPVITRVRITVNAPPATLEIDEGIDPVGPMPGTLVWGGWQTSLFTAAWTKVGQTLIAGDTCSIARAAGPLPCNVVLSPALPGTQRVTITYSGVAVEQGEVTFKIHGQPFHARIHACALTPSPRVPATLFAGANLQRLELGASPECLRRMSHGALQLHKDDARLPAIVETDQAGRLIRATLTNVPQSVAAGTWQIEDAGGLHLGEIFLKASQSPLRVKPADPSGGPPLLAISYDLRDFELNLDAQHDGKSRDGMAVVTGTQHDWGKYVHNDATLEPDQDLLALANSLRNSTWEPVGAVHSTQKVDCQSVVNSCDDLEAKFGAESDCRDDILPAEDTALDECHQARRPWRVTPRTWASDVWLSEDAWWTQGQVFDDQLGTLRFAIFRPRPDPLEVAIELAQYNPATKSDEIVFRQYVKLASGARFESMPLPLASALYVECGHHRSTEAVGLFPAKNTVRSDRYADVVFNGYTRAVEDADVLSGSCRLHYSPEMLVSALKLTEDEKGVDILNYYGTQELAVTVRRGEAEETFPFRIEPAVEKEIELKVPRDAKNATGIYAVSAVLQGPALPSVAWRTPQSGADGATTDRLADLAFHANLRPRGPFGWRVAPIRMFLTLPVSFTGVRFPARPSELASTSDSPNAQVTKIMGGALLAVEPWNYDTGANPWPVPTRFVTGMNLYNASNGRFTPSWLTGVSLTFPIIDLQKGVTEDQLGTDVALGFFWETDVTEKDWLHHGNHFLITFGINLLTLFGSK